MKIRKFACALFTLVLASALSAFAGDKFTTIYAFKGNAGSGNPAFQLVEDGAGNLYGTTFWGGDMHACKDQGCGVAFRLSPLSNGQWKYTELYQFPGYNAGTEPSNLILDAAGNLYGEMSDGGFEDNGLVFELSPTASGPWTFTTLYTFQGTTDGSGPNGGLVFDADGNLYGTTHYTQSSGGGHGTVFKLTPQACGVWTQSVIWGFNQSGSYNPNAGVIFDSAGNLYGTTAGGESGTVFKLSPGSSGWTGTILYAFPYSEILEAPVTIDASGNLFGTTTGTVFELSPTGSGTYTYNLLHTFTSAEGKSYYGVTLDSAGNLLGVADGGSPSPYGEIFKGVKSGTSWSFGTVHVFNGSDGYQPNTLIMDASGNFYGVSNYGDVAGCINDSGCGTVFKLTPEPAAKN